MVGVLVFVDQDVTETTTVILGDLRVALQHRNGLADQVVEIERVCGAQATLVLGKHLSDDPGEIVTVRRQRGHRLLGCDQLVLQVGDRVGQQARGVPLDVNAHIAADHQQQPTGVVSVVDGEIGVASG